MDGLWSLWSSECVLVLGRGDVFVFDIRRFHVPVLLCFARLPASPRDPDPDEEGNDAHESDAGDDAGLPLLVRLVELLICLAQLEYIGVRISQRNFYKTAR